jgi:hypothetical protein
MTSKLGSAATGAAGGAAAGSVLGPWGTAGGAIIGGIAGWLSGGGPSDAEIAAQQRQQAERDNATQIARVAAEGGAPSAAQALLNRNVTSANDLAFSQAKGIAGANPALAATLASNQSAQNSETAIQQAAQLRADEMATARAQYLAATGANVDVAQARDAQATAQKNVESAYNQQLFNSAIGGAAQAGGRIAAAQNAGAVPAANAVSTPSANPGNDAQIRDAQQRLAAGGYQ